MAYVKLVPNLCTFRVIQLFYFLFRQIYNTQLDSNWYFSLKKIRKLILLTYKKHLEQSNVNYIDIY